MTWLEGPVRVRVPATSANLGPGFDALGLALTLHDEVEARILPAGVSIEITGEGADLADVGEEHLVLRAMRATFAVTGGQPPGIGLRCLNRIPHGRGLGSSAAAIVAGILAAQALSAQPLSAQPRPRSPCPSTPCPRSPVRPRPVRAGPVRAGPSAQPRPRMPCPRRPRARCPPRPCSGWPARSRGTPTTWRPAWAAG